MAHFEILLQGHLLNDTISGLLWQWPFESMLELESGVKAYIYEGDLTDEIRQGLIEMAEQFSLKISFVSIQDENWNELWEKSFQPVSIDDFCYIRADFHPDNERMPHRIIINPKMAFGTAHHETTYMMIQTMKNLVFQNKSVFDYGTGTGILAILAEQMGADYVVALDYDKNSTDNTFESISLNNCEKIEVHLGEIDVIKPTGPFDIILANINIIVLREQANNLAALTIPNGTLLLSGILNTQKDQIIKLYEGAGFSLQSFKTKGDWTCMLFEYLVQPKNSTLK